MIARTPHGTRSGPWVVGQRVGLAPGQAARGAAGSGLGIGSSARRGSWTSTR
jgi:hypothetical protein